LLVCLRGGADGLSLVVPRGEPRYYEARPRTAIPADQAIDLDGHFGLHPGLAALLPWWRRGALAVLPAVGLPDPPSDHAAAWARLVPLLAGAWPCAPDAPLAASLAAVARLVAEDRAPAVACVASGGWDTHLNQGAASGRLAGRVAELGGALATFATGLGERLRDVVIVTVSEFGRTVRENRNGGTDHGAATALLALGGPVHGGRVLGGWPGLGSAATGGTAGLRAATDLTDVVAEIRTRHLGRREPGVAARFAGLIRG
jgi:uncharacterized protein (DUF1501 family)